MGKEPLNRIGVVLREHGIKNQFIADRLKITKTSVSNYVNNVHQPSLEVLYQIATIINVSVTDLLRPDLKVLPKVEPRKHKKRRGTP